MLVLISSCSWTVRAVKEEDTNSSVTATSISDLFDLVIIRLIFF